MECEFCNEVAKLVSESNNAKWLPKMCMTDEVMKAVQENNLPFAKFIEPDILKLQDINDCWHVYRIVGKCFIRLIHHLEWPD